MLRSRPPARTPLRTRVHGLAFSLGLLAAAAGCKGSATTGPDKLTTADQRALQGAPEGVALPDPVPLPAAPATLIHVERPGDLDRLAATWTPAAYRGQLAASDLLAMELSFFVGADMAQRIAQSVDPEQSWDAVEFGGDSGHAIFHLPVKAAALADLQTAFAGLPAGEGADFGAVRLPAGAGASGEVLAWARETTQGPRLTLAKTAPGLVAGVQLRETYGRAPIVAHVDSGRLRLPSEAAPLLERFERVEAEGRIEDLTATVRLREGYDPLAEAELGPGAMGALLSDPETLLGATSRYLGYKAAVSRVIAQIQSQLDDLPFLLKGLATDLAARFNSILRSWNGRTLLAFADGHVRVAYGADDPKKSGVAVLHFLRGALDGLSLARNFSSDVPDIRLKKNAARSGDVQVHRLDVLGAQRMVGPLAPLLDENKALHVAMAFDPRFGGGVMVIGPRADAQLVGWVERFEGKVGPIDEAPVVAARAAVSAAQLGELDAGMRRGDLDLAAVWAFKREGPPVDIELRRVDARNLSLRFRGPKPVQQMQVAFPAAAAAKPVR